MGHVVTLCEFKIQKVMLRIRDECCCKLPVGAPLYMSPFRGSVVVVVGGGGVKGFMFSCANGRNLPSELHSDTLRFWKHLGLARREITGSGFKYSTSRALTTLLLPS